MNRLLYTLSKRPWLVASLLSLLFAGMARADLFDAHDPIAITLELPYADLVEQLGAGEDPENKPVYLGARLTFRDPNLGEQTVDVRVKARGRLRRRPEICYFPPIWIDFKKKSVKGTLFEGQNKVKLVAHCRGDAIFEQYVMKEFLVYRTLNLLTDHSFRVRLARVTYKDLKGKRKPRTKYAFFIEAEKDLGDRIGGKIVKTNRVKRRQYDPAALNLASVFQYMIGNTDFSLLKGPGDERCCHTGRPFSFPDPDAPFVPVPYDFDIAGMVDTPYAIPDPHFELASVRERIYRGFCHKAGVLEGTIEVFHKHRSEITELWNTQPELKPRIRKIALAYISSFYAIIDNPKKRQRRIESKCR